MANEPTQHPPAAPVTGSPPGDTLMPPANTSPPPASTPPPAPAESGTGPPTPSGGAAALPSTVAPATEVAKGPIYLQPGARPISDYELVQKLGAGGFGEVWKATGPGGFPVALKFLRLDERAGATELRSLEVMKNIRHPHLLAMFGMWQVEGWLIIALELGDRTLHQRLTEARLQKKPGIPLLELLEYMREAAKGIDHLNELGIQHRDIKPQNFLLVGGGLKVADFGLAKILENSFASNSGAMTPGYAAPEFFQGQTSPHSDQYSLAVTYCQLRGGKLPFDGNPMQVMFMHLQEDPDLTMLPAKERPPIARAMAKKPASRWPNCKAFVNALYTACGVQSSSMSVNVAEVEEAVASKLSTKDPLSKTVPYSIDDPARPPTQTTSSRGRKWLALAALVLVAGLGGAAFWWREPLQEWAGLTQASQEREPGQNGKDNDQQTEPPTKSKTATDKSAKDDTKSKPVIGKSDVPVAKSKDDAGKAKSKEMPKVIEKMPAKDKGKQAPEKTPATVASIELIKPKDMLLKPGGTARQTLHVKRTNYNEPIQVKISGIPEGIEARYDRIPVGENECALELKAPRPFTDREVELTVLASARDLQSSKRFRLTIQTPPLAKDFTNGAGMKLVLIPAGKFTRGSPTTESGRGEDEGPPREVEISRPFYLGTHEVTQEQFEKVMKRNPSWFRQGGEGQDAVKGEDTAKLPVEMVSWKDANDFCKRLSEMPEEVQAGRVYRLPTEAEWEYACSADKPATFADARTMIVQNPNVKRPTRPAPASTVAANPRGLYGMFGNVFEWCSDWYDPEYYVSSPAKDPPGPITGQARVMRGGAWCYTSRHARPAARNSAEPGFRSYFVGFRVAMTPAP